MKNIVLLCSTGASTSVLCNNMKKAAAEMNYDCTINAYSITKLEEIRDDADIIFIGPQIRFQSARVRDQVKCKVIDIDMRIYGKMDGKALMEIVKKELD